MNFVEMVYRMTEHTLSCLQLSAWEWHSLFFFNDTATTEIYTLSLHDRSSDLLGATSSTDSRSWKLAMIRAFVNFRLRSEEHTSELQSRQYLVCRLLLEKKKVVNQPHQA